MTDPCQHCRTFAEEANQLHNEIVGLQAEVLKQMREKAALRGMLTKQRKAEDIGRHVQAVLRMWRSLCSPRSSISPSGKNADNVRTAFLHYTNPELPVGQRRRLLYDCVRGYAMRPYDAGYARRTANPQGVVTPQGWSGAVRRVTTAYIFASEERIEQGAGYYRMVQAKPLEWKYRAWQAASGTERVWQSLWFVAAQHDDVARRAHWEREYGVAGLRPPEDRAAHLFLDDVPREERPVGDQRPQLRLIEGEAA